MPCTFNPNKPTHAISKRKHERGLILKRAQRAKLVRTIEDAAPNAPSDPKSIRYYKDILALGSGVVTKTLSKKRAKKLERNARLVARAKQKLDHDLEVQQGGMDVEMPLIKREKKQKQETQLDKIKKALWNTVKEPVSSTMNVDTSGEGTTIGIQAF